MKYDRSNTEVVLDNKLLLEQGSSCCWFDCLLLELWLGLNECCFEIELHCRFVPLAIEFCSLLFLL